MQTLYLSLQPRHISVDLSFACVRNVPQLRSECMCMPLLFTIRVLHALSACGLHAAFGTALETTAYSRHFGAST